MATFSDSHSSIIELRSKRFIKNKNVFDTVSYDASKGMKRMQIMVTDEALIHCETNEMIVKWKDIRQICLGRCTKVFQQFPCARRKSHRLYFSIIPISKYGTKTFNFEVRNHLDRNLIFAAMVMQLDFVGKEPMDWDESNNADIARLSKETTMEIEFADRLRDKEERTQIIEFQ